MNNEKIIYGVFAVFCVVLLIIFYKIYSIDKELNKTNQILIKIENNLKILQTKYDFLDQRIKKINESFNEEIRKNFLDANSTLNKLKANLSNIGKDIKNKEKELYQIFKNLNILNNKIKEKLKWLDDNSEISEKNEIIKKIKAKCKVNTINTTFLDILLNKKNISSNETLSLPCVWSILHDEYNITYIEDTCKINVKNPLSILFPVPQECDWLASINETLSKKGGDCEDLSLLFAAVVRSIPHKNVVVSIDKNFSTAILYKDNEWVYYLENTSLIKENNYSYIYVVCGEKNNSFFEGHCLNIVCNSSFNKNSSLTDFIKKHCTFVEPQDYAEISGLKEVWFIITKNDICEKNFCWSDLIFNFTNTKKA